MQKLLLVCSVVLLLISSCKRHSEEGQNSNQRVRRVARVGVWKIEPQEVRYSIDTTGSLEADEIRIHARVAGVITKLSFHEGDRVTTEQNVLAEIDPERYVLELEKSRAEKDRAEAACQKARSDHATRVDLHAKGVATKDEVTTYETMMKEAQAVLAQSAAVLALAEKNRHDSMVRPPLAGIIQSKAVVLGEYVKPETLIATLVDLSTLRLRFTVPESEASRLANGQPVVFTHKTTANQEHTAEIFYISQSAHPQTRRVEVKARNIKIAGNGATGTASSLKPGYFVTVRVQTDVHAGAVVIPAQAVLPTEHGFVAFVLDDKKVRRRTVTLGLHTRDEKIEILAGLQPGETLIVEGASVLRDGMEVDVVPDKKSK